MLKTPRRKTDPRRGFAVGLALMAGSVSASSSSAAALQCTLDMASLAPPTLRLVLSNRSTSTLAVLNWGTPFEGWMQPFILITRDGVALDYQGPSVKRGDPERGEYLRLPAGRSRSATLALAPAFNVSAPGHYRIEPRITLHDVTAKALPRPRSAHRSQALECAALEFDLR